MKKLILSSIMILTMGVGLAVYGQNPVSPAALVFCPASGACAAGTPTQAKMYAGLVGLNASGLASISFPAFTSTATYTCVGTDKTGANPVQMTNNAATQSNITGTASHQIGYICAGY